MTSAHDPTPGERERFEHLLRGHASLLLTRAEAEELRVLAAADPARTRQVEEFTCVHDAFARERALLRAVRAPAEPAEEADEGHQRLARASVRAEEELRGRLLHTRPIVPLRARRRSAVWARVGLVVAVAAALFLVLRAVWPTSPPALVSGVPRDERAGQVVASIQMAPHVSSIDRSLSWSPVWHAQGYEVEVVDADGAVMMRRPSEQSRSTRWELTPDQIERLRARTDLRLRVRALDSSGLLVGATGDLPLRVE